MGPGVASAPLSSTALAGGAGALESCSATSSTVPSDTPEGVWLLGDIPLCLKKALPGSLWCYRREWATGNISREFCRLSSADQPSLYSPKPSDLWVFPGPACECWGAQVKVFPGLRQLWGDAHHEQLCPGWRAHRVSLQDPSSWGNQHRDPPHCPLLRYHTAPGLVLLGDRAGGARAGSALLQPCQGSSCCVRAPQVVLQLLLNLANVGRKSQGWILFKGFFSPTGLPGGSAGRV